MRGRRWATAAAGEARGWAGQGRRNPQGRVGGKLKRKEKEGGGCGNVGDDFGPSDFDPTTQNTVRCIRYKMHAAHYSIWIYIYIYQEHPEEFFRILATQLSDKLAKIFMITC